MDLRRNEYDGLKRLASLWKTTEGAEFEAMLTGVDLTAWQDVVQYLRSLGMRETTTIDKMNICLSNNIRLTLEGSGAIQPYFRDNRISDKPFVAMLKETIQGADPVNLESYAVRLKLKREIPLAADDQRVIDALSRWDTLGKHFRMIQRFEFVAPGGVPIRFDVSIVRENAGRPARTVQDANVMNQPERYEIEVELTARREAIEVDAVIRDIMRGVAWILQGRQRSFVLVSNQAAEAVRDGLTELFYGAQSSGRNGRNNGGRNSNARNRAGPTPSFRFPGPQPATLERKNMTAVVEPGVPNVRTGYNVTDKADGLRCLLYVAETGKIFLVDGGGRVYATGKQTDAGLAGTVIDGEWIRRNKDGRPTSHYMAFDIMAVKGKTDVAKLPFLVTGSEESTGAEEATRLATMSSIIAKLDSAHEFVRNVPANQKIQFGTKSFRTAEGVALFRDAAAAALDAAKEYNTDGLIFTPNAAPLPIGRGTWSEQLKWKPPHENTIDFLVIVDKERTKEGAITAVDAVTTKFREDTGQMVRCKTLRLFVGSNKDQAFADPRRTVLAGEALPTSLEEGEWREVEFRPTAPRDPMAAICFVPIEDAMDEMTDNVIRATRTRDPILSNMIVEMAYYPERAPGWRWEPTRVRHDKTERWLAQQAVGSRRGGTMNADWVANAIWTTLHNPVTEEAVRSGRLTECLAPAALEGPIAPHKSSRAPRRDLVKVQCMTNFHEDFIKRGLLLGPAVLQSGMSICDLAMGYGQDIAKWITAGVSFAFGCDVNATALNDPRDGAYRVLMDKMIAMGGRDSVPPMVFAQADVARRLPTGEAGLTGEDQALLKREFSAMGHLPMGADVVSCMFSVPYMFRDADTLSGFLNTLADTVKVGGLFVGCCLDGDAVARMLNVAETKGESTIVGRDGHTDVWMITNTSGMPISASAPASEAGLGIQVDVNFIANGESRTEYLVSWPYFQQRLAEVGLEPVTDVKELAVMGLPASTQLFSDTWSLANEAGKTYEMTGAIKKFSFLHRWWVLRRRTDARPEPPRVTPAPPGALTELAPTTEAVAPVPSVSSAVPQPDVAQDTEAEEAVQIDLGAPFLVGGSGDAADDMRLGSDFSDWQRFLMLNAQSEITGADGTEYPSVEAAMAAFKIDSAAPLDPAKPPPKGRGAKMFGVKGIYHQEFERRRAEKRAAGVTNWTLFDKITQEESASICKRSAGTEFKQYGLRWDKAAWDAVKMEKYREYLTQRYAKDARFRSMLQTIVGRGGEILYVCGSNADGNDLGVGVDADGNVLGGGNALGRMLMSLVAGSGTV